MPHPQTPMLAAAAAVLLSATIAGAQDEPEAVTLAPNGTVMARMATADGTDLGTVTFRQMRAGVLVEVDLTGLPPGHKGFHVHETGACEPDFSAAGEHLAPDGAPHGFAQTETPHAGDFENLIVAADGTAQGEFLNWRLTYDDLLDDDGSAVIVHSGRDTYVDPDSAGERIACGVVDQLS